MKQALRQAVLVLVATGLAATAGAHAAEKESAYPAKPIRFVVPYHPGGTPDIQGRRFAEKLRQRLGQPVIVDNRPGANASIGMGIVVRAPADGYTIVIAPVGPWTVNPHLYRLPYDVFTDLAPIIHATATPGALAVHPSVPVHSVKELIALAREKPGVLNYGSTGIGGFGHMSAELFSSMTRTRMMHIPQKSISAALTDLIGGHIHVLFNVASPTIPVIKSGKVRGLATTGGKRLEALPDLPTVAEAGVPGYENSTWNGIGAPARTPRAIIERLNREFVAILHMPDVEEAARIEGSTIVASTPEQFRDYLKAEFAKYGKLVKEAGIKADVVD